MAVDAATILAVFEDRGLRNTRPRRLIAGHLAAVAASGADFSTEELWSALQGTDPEVGRATVYRAVEVLTDNGMLDRVEFADGVRRYRVCSVGHHHHVTCSTCRRVVEVDACLSPELVSDIEQVTDFRIDGHSLELYGRCSACREMSPA